MWPGEQPPGGAQNPQNNPYQQPGYQQPNPYQQPGYQQQPQQPYGQQQWGPAAPVGAPQAPQPPQGGGGGGRTKLIAIIAATAVVVAAGVTGYLVLGGSKHDEADSGKDNQQSSQAPKPKPKPTATATGSGDNPRGNETEKPTIPGWKVVVNPRWGTAFDVPADWEVETPGTSIGFSDDKSDDGKPLVMMSAPAQLMPKWCTTDSDKDGRTEDTALAAVGTKGESGAKTPGDAAVREVPWWVYGGYTQPDKKSITYDKKAKDYTTKSGVKGAYAWARSSHTPQKGKCASDGKALTFGFKNSAGDIVSWNFYGAKGVDKEVDTKTIMTILSTVRLHGDPTAS
ncbi:hypothetical protein [Streptomyces sp. L2]|uniref:hypothetical protein n=1 Tax=Streptomyces sp. L2 TaxID=2162665 RepID=UPI00101088E9|nr:hypothetical protein [Streptomyces sp. L2]